MKREENGPDSVAGRSGEIAGVAGLREALEWSERGVLGICAADYDECTITVAMKDEESVRAAMRSMPHAHRVRLVEQGPSPVPETVSEIAPISPDRIAEVMSNGDGFWRSCPGCFETSDGYNVNGYPYIRAFKCIAGGGCSECGGIGVIWDATDYADMVRGMLAHDASTASGSTSQPAQDTKKPNPNRGS